MASMGRARSNAEIQLAGDGLLHTQNTRAENQPRVRANPLGEAAMTAADLALDLMEVAALLATLALIQTGCRMSRIACLGSLSVRLPMILLVLSVIRDDWMLGLVAVVTLISGDAGLVLLARWAGDAA